MIAFFIGLALLLISGCFYSIFCERVFGPDGSATPAYKFQNGVDYLPMSESKNALIQQLNIAGTGAVLGPILAFAILTGVGLLLYFAKYNGESFAKLWRYFAWNNQTSAVFMFAVIVLYLAEQEKKDRFCHFTRDAKDRPWRSGIERPCVEKHDVLTFKP